MAGKDVDAATARLDAPASREKWAAVLDAAQFMREQEDALLEVIFLNQKNEFLRISMNSLNDAANGKLYLG